MTRGPDLPPAAENRRRPNMSDDNMRAEHTPAALNGFRRLVRIWGLTAKQASVLLDVSPRTWVGLATGNYPRTISLDMMTRISALFGIFGALRTVFSEPLCYTWVKRPNADPLFDGATALDFMLSKGVSDILRVRQRVDAMARRM